MTAGVPNDPYGDGGAITRRDAVRDTRRDTLRATLDEWDEDFRRHCMCPLKFELPDVRAELHEMVRDLEFKEYSIVNYHEWPEGPAVDAMRPFFDVFAKHTRNRLIFHNTPMETMVPHTDPIRGFAVYMPIWPLGNDYTPMEIYWQDNFYGLPPNDEPRMYAFNPKKIHAVFNNRFFRYNMQISIDLPYEEALEIYSDVFDLSSS